jgi:two-component system nitrate/nitrite response regulator NarL
MSNDSSVRIVIADGHAIFRAALRTLLDSQPGFRVVGDAADGREAVRLARQLRPDILLLNLVIPEPLSGEVFGELNSPVESRIVLLTPHFDNDSLAIAFQRGVRGFVLPSSSVATLVKGIRAVAEGECWVGTQHVANPTALFRVSAPAQAAVEENGWASSLTHQEYEVVLAALAGLSAGDMMHHLAMQPEVLKRCFVNIYQKLSVSNRLELALFACSHRISKTAAVPVDVPAESLQAPSWRQAG